METETAALAEAIGVRVRAERHTRRWTLDQLADAAGVSRRMLINVEQGAANPSVGTLLRIAGALGLGLPALVESPRRGSVTVTRAGDGATLWTGEHGGRGVLVTSSASPDVVELWDWTLAAGDSRNSEPHPPGTRELLHLHEGNLTLTTADVTTVLAPGDAVAFPGDVSHGYANTGTVPARFSLTVVEPGTGPVTRPEVRHAQP